MKEERVILCAYWRERPITAKEYIRVCFEFLKLLRAFSSAFDRQCVVVGQLPSVVPELVPESYDAFEQLMLKAVPDPANVYLNPDPSNKDFTLRSTFRLGFRATFSDSGSDTSKPTSLSVSVTAGAHGGPHTPTNVVLIEIPTDYREFWEHKNRAKQLMDVVVSTWHPAFAALSSGELRQALDPKSSNNFPLGPITYFADSEAGIVAKSTASVESAADGGAFLSIDAPYPWSASVDRFRPCYARLNNAGLLQWPHNRQPAAP